MRLFPSARLVGAAAALTLASLVLPLFPWLVPLFLAVASGLLLLVLFDALLLRRSKPPVLVRRLPERAAVGRDAALVLTIHNPGTSEARVAIFEDWPASLGPLDDAPLHVRVPPAGRASHTLTLHPVERGDARFGPALVLETTALGLLQRRSLQGDGDTLRVHPDTTRMLRPEALDPRRALQALGVRAARRRGDGTDFESLRDWVGGDDPRRLDWAASARRGRPVVRVHQHEKSHTVILALDASRLMAARSGARSKLDHAIDAGLALAFAALATGDRVGLAVFDDALRAQLSPRSRKQELGDFVEALRPVQPRLVEAEYDALLRHLSSRRQQRALVVILTDFVEAAAARLLPPLVVLARKHQVLLVALRDPLFDVLDPRSDVGVAGSGSAIADVHGVERRLVLDDLLREREKALATLRRAGLQTLDVVPEAVTTALLNRYLALRAEAA